MSKSSTAEIGLFDAKILQAAAIQAFAKLDPRSLVRNPVIFVTALVSVLATILAAREVTAAGANAFIAVQIALWLWFTVLFANFAEAVAEGRGKARADSLPGHQVPASAARVLVVGDPP